MEFKYFIGGTILLFAVFIVGSLFVTTASHTTVSDCTVEDKDRSTNSDGASVYRVYSDCGVFDVSDSIVYGQWNSADVYADIEIGKSYDFETTGFRNGLFSLFPGIIGITPAN